MIDGKIVNLDTKIHLLVQEDLLKSIPSNP